ncbi:MAG: hypothetical protein IKA07_04415 [Alistipes sp.]|nr:hypothetical protein [Alistipes sp.]
MANICFTQYVVEGDMSELKDLYAKMRSLEEGKAPLVDDGADKTWLANLVNLLGGDYNDYDCRGSFYDVELNTEKGILTYSVQSKWVELEQVRDFLEEHYSSLTFYFRAEEGGCAIYETNDLKSKYFERHKLSFNNIDFERIELYFFTLQELFDKVSELMDEKVDSLEEMQRLFDEYNGDSEAELCYNHFEKPTPNLFF